MFTRRTYKNYDLTYTRLTRELRPSIGNFGEDLRDRHFPTYDASSIEFIVPGFDLSSLKHTSNNFKGNPLQISGCINMKIIAHLRDDQPQADLIFASFGDKFCSNIFNSLHT